MDAEMLRTSLTQPQSSQAMRCPMEDKLMREEERQKTTYDVFHPVLSLIPSHLWSSSTAPPSAQTVPRHSPNPATYGLDLSPSSMSLSPCRPVHTLSSHSLRAWSNRRHSCTHSSWTQCHCFSTPRCHLVSNCYVGLDIDGGASTSGGAISDVEGEIDVGAAFTLCTRSVIGVREN